MEKEQLEQARKLLRLAKMYITDNHMVHAVYYSPAQQMRKAADEMEKKESFLIELDKFLNS